jgi:hypothetical protein
MYGYEINVHMFYTPAVGEGEWSALCFAPGERFSVTQGIVGWMGQIPSVNIVAKRKCLFVLGIEPVFCSIPIHLLNFKVYGMFSCITLINNIGLRGISCHNV